MTKAVLVRAARRLVNGPVHVNAADRTDVRNREVERERREVRLVRPVQPDHPPRGVFERDAENVRLGSVRRAAMNRMSSVIRLSGRSRSSSNSSLFTTKGPPGEKECSTRHARRHGA